MTLEDINIQIGDSVNYTYDTADNYLLLSTYSGYSSNQTIAQDTTLTWKVLNVDKENDTVDIISTEPISSTVYFSDILGYSNGPYLMNEICKAHYSNTTLGLNARSINLLDMEKHLTEQGIVKRNGNSAGNGYGETMTYTSFANTFFNYYPKLYANQIGGGINTTSIVKPDITKGNDPYKESEALATTEPTTDNSYEQAENGLTVTHTAYSITINDENYGEAGEVMKSENDFWVAARYVYADGDFAGFGLRTANTAVNMRPDNGLMFYSNISTDSDGYALRPVVSLSSNLLTGEKTNDAWDLSK